VGDVVPAVVREGPPDGLERVRDEAAVVLPLRLEEAQVRVLLALLAERLLEEEGYGRLGARLTRADQCRLGAAVC
jgi:hypothetical protein